MNIYWVYVLGVVDEISITLLLIKETDDVHVNKWKNFDSNICFKIN